MFGFVYSLDIPPEWVAIGGIAIVGGGLFCFFLLDQVIKQFETHSPRRGG